MPCSFKAIIFGMGAVFVLTGGRRDPDSNGAEQVRSASRQASRGRERPPMPRITRPVMFNTPEADRILSALQVFPPDNPWNEDISKRPVHPGSTSLIATVGADKGLAYNSDMAFILVSPDQK